LVSPGNSTAEWARQLWWLFFQNLCLEASHCFMLGTAEPIFAAGGVYVSLLVIIRRERKLEYAKRALSLRGFAVLLPVQ